MHKTINRFFDAVDFAVQEAEGIISYCSRREGLRWSVKQTLIIALNRYYLNRFKKCRPPMKIYFATMVRHGRPFVLVRVVARFRSGWRSQMIASLGPLATALLTQCVN